jgi:stress-induced morphogen
VSRKQNIEQRIEADLTPLHLEVVDESHMHSSGKGAESHFKVVVVSEAFDGAMRVERHRRIHQLLQSELDAGLHALTMTLLTPSEFEKRGGETIASPNCMGGSKG